MASAAVALKTKMDSPVTCISYSEFLLIVNGPVVAASLEEWEIACAQDRRMIIFLEMIKRR